MSVTTVVICVLAVLSSLAVAVSTAVRARPAFRIDDGRFLLAFSGLLAAVTAANGVVAPEEVAIVEGYLSKMGLTMAEKAICYGNFRLRSRKRCDAHAYVRKLASQFSRTGCTFLYALAWKVALADGNVDRDEDRLLREIAADFGFGNEVYAWFKANEAPVLSRSELRKAGVPPSLLHLVK